MGELVGLRNCPGMSVGNSTVLKEVLVDFPRLLPWVTAGAPQPRCYTPPGKAIPHLAQAGARWGHPAPLCRGRTMAASGPCPFPPPPPFSTPTHSCHNLHHPLFPPLLGCCYQETFLDLGRTPCTVGPSERGVITDTGLAGGSFGGWALGQEALRPRQSAPAW